MLGNGISMGAYRGGAYAGKLLSFAGKKRPTSSPPVTFQKNGKQASPLLVGGLVTLAGLVVMVLKEQRQLQKLIDAYQVMADSVDPPANEEGARPSIDVVETGLIDSMRVLLDDTQARRGNFRPDMKEPLRIVAQGVLEGRFHGTEKIDPELIHLSRRMLLLIDKA